MRKTGVVAALVLVLAGSCATSPTEWDKAYPQEQSAEIFFFDMTVTSYNGIGVKGWRHVRIPAGEITIGADVNISHAGARFILHDMEFGCYLEQRKKYTIIGVAREAQWGVNVYEGIGGWIGTTPDDTRLLEFIPFKNQPDTFK
ncbi:MAG: hypothetical protein LBK63_02850 [Treponema sp.]|jgi:hypothetical protein|nr:hypothetical protein [Treponema sp.]